MYVPQHCVLEWLQPFCFPKYERTGWLIHSLFNDAASVLTGHVAAVFVLKVCISTGTADLDYTLFWKSPTGSMQFLYEHRDKLSLS